MLFLSHIALAKNSKCCRPDYLPTKTNLDEVQIVVLLVRYFIRCGIEAKDIGVVTPYRAQVRALNLALSSFHMDAGLGDKEFEVNTADQYQGRDKSIIIVSFVSCLNASSASSKIISEASEKSSHSSILNDWPRLAVTLTRAKLKLILIGCGCSNHQESGTHKLDISTEPLQKLLSILQQESVVVSLPPNWQTGLVIP